MSKDIEAYLDQLKVELAGCDPATIQDALSDAEEHLRTALDQVLESQTDLSESEAIRPIIARYGTPGEIAAAYIEIEARITPPLARPKTPDKRHFISRFFGVLADPRAYAAFLYMLFSLATGIVYFTWAITGLSLSAGLVVLIIGLPFFGLFLLSVRGLALVEGRIIEALLGVRM
ncbi:MAG: sensor domain-containing protein, partial [Candidatus Krumholzibacteria bacterium]|nr:sensor domain-containing protein [Candidatus Krumholzibacteria bacterium]